MKRALLFTLFICLFTFSANAQLGVGCDDCMGDHERFEDQQKPNKNKKKKISVYPNPATNFIGLSDTENVETIILFNVMGKEERRFNVEKGMKYNVADLRRGMYLVQILDKKNKIITTTRLNKR